MARRGRGGRARRRAGNRHRHHGVGVRHMHQRHHHHHVRHVRHANRNHTVITGTGHMVHSSNTPLAAVNLQRRQSVFTILGIFFVVGGIVAMVIGISSDVYFVIGPAAFFFSVGFMFICMACCMKKAAQNVRTTTMTAVASPAPAHVYGAGGPTVHPETFVFQGGNGATYAATHTTVGAVGFPPAAPMGMPQPTPYSDPGFVPPYPGPPGPPMPQPYVAHGPDAVHVEMPTPPYPTDSNGGIRDSDKMPPPPSYDDVVNK